MNITTIYLGPLRHRAGKEEETRVYPDSASLLDVLNEVAVDYDDTFRGTLFDDAGAIRSSIMVLHNDSPISKDQPPTLQDGDRLTLLAAIAGG